MSEPHDPRELVTARLVDATPDQVFRAYEEPERLARWWGPNGFRSTFEHFDFRTGGEWRFMFHGPDGRDYPNRAIWREIERPARIVLENVRDNESHFVLTMTLVPEVGRTRITWRQRFPTPEMREQLAPICAPSNEQNLDRLEAELARIND
jgi:uncharacterized protein YndB with AHSA1/START domain